VLVETEELPTGYSVTGELPNGCLETEELPTGTSVTGELSTDYATTGEFLLFS